MHIRKSSLADLEGINQLLSTCYAKLMKDAYSPDTLSKALPFISKARPELLSSNTYFTATADNGDIIGCGGWTPYSPSQNDVLNSNTGHIRHFATHPDYTKQGIARSIFDICKDQALNNSINFFECYSSLNAEGFYQSLGFSTLQKIEIPIKDDVSFPCVLMKYTL